MWQGVQGLPETFNLWRGAAWHFRHAASYMAGLVSSGACGEWQVRHVSRPPADLKHWLAASITG